MEKSFLDYIKNGILNNWEKPALTDINGQTFRYSDLAREITKIQLLLSAFGIKKSDRVALCGRNSSHWAISFFGSISYGAVPTTILQDFNAESIYNIVNHSEAKTLFVAEAVWKRLDLAQMPALTSIVLLEDFSIIKTNNQAIAENGFDAEKALAEKFPAGLTKEDIYFHKESPEELALLNYTSGTTSNPKGVMLPYRSLWSNTRFAVDNIPFVKAGDGLVNMLPMAHMYGLAFEILLSVAKGCHVYFISKPPSPNVIIDAFAKAKPRLVIAVPLIIEKIVRNVVFPQLEKQPVRTLLKIPGVRSIMYRKIKNKMMDTFGGNLVEVVIGGAALSKEVGDFLSKIKFPYTVGYGMTECGPLVTYEYWASYKAGSCGRAVDRLEIKVDSPDPAHTAGEIFVRGHNVMLGYLKNEEATRAVLSADGWLNTGDLGVIDKDGFVFIRGRSKTMILGASGQNIYPEEIEDVLNGSPIVAESLVIESEGKLVALVYPDQDYLKTNRIQQSQLPQLLDEEIKVLNKRLPSYSRIAKVRIRTEEFEKTPKKSIKRFLYQENIEKTN
ncbi:long-chain acyl-CoA synthetase [Dysgonomonas sp. PH5-45]|uniref:AMP-binding protein n=1 Tax=unclassified Dysgonomonas TaxID=2630389 RepID=UPI0024755FAD|nr:MULTISPECIES: AMP-binding protein [unclassified Dysgonomonas]MDH6354569.1 long-chain acyl-CoA synthetase [Dysgonomonas sp. PH5-45]MDH6387375.1 long-chain acyl-CoA synthetase [Dysgonomonas sp. PH5-37]